MSKPLLKFGILLASMSVMLSCPLNAAQAKPVIKASKPAPAKPSASTKPTTAGTGTAQGKFTAAYTAYINRLRSKLDRNWYLADGKNKVTLSVSVAADGGVTELNVSSSPSNPQAEQAANDAFNSSQPLEALPAGSPPVKLTLTFDSYADPHGDNNRSITGNIQPTAPETPPAGSEPPAASKQSSDSGNENGSSQ